MNLHKVYNLNIVFLASFPLFSLRTSNFIAILWCILSLIILIKNKSYKYVSKQDIYSIFIFCTYYFFIIGSYFSSGFNKEFFKILETTVLMFLCPFFIIINKNYIEKKYLKNSLILFFISNVILSVVTWVLILKIGYSKLAEQDNYYQPVFRNIFSETTSIHLPYLGLFFVFSIFISVYYIFKHKPNVYIKTLVVFFDIILLVSVFVFSARMSLFSLILISIYLLYTKIKSKFVRILIPLAVVLLSFLLVIFTPVKKRIQEIANTKLQLPSYELNDKSHLVNFRYGIYYCANNIIKNNFFFGIGKENVSSQMNNCYKTFSYSNFDDFQNKKYNTHNQYIDILISYGIFGLLILLISIFFGFYKNQNELYQIFLILIFLALLTENLFERQLGVMFFSFFNSLFYIHKQKI